MSNRLAGLIISIAILAFTVYVLMDAFVITRVETPALSDNPPQTAGVDPNGGTSSEGDGTGAAGQSGTFTDTSYTDENISITITTHREYDTNIHVADVTLSSAEYLKTAFAKGAYGKNIKAETSETAENVNAIFAVNGDYYSVREVGYVLRNGTLHRNTPSDREDLVIYKDGSFSMIEETAVSAEQLLADGAEQILCFGPGLVKGGEIAVADNSDTTNPRTGIGWVDGLHYIFVVTDGRTADSEGLTYYQLAQFMQSLGVKEAYNLDGGGSSAMYFNGKTVNTTARGNERQVSDIVYIGY